MKAVRGTWRTDIIHNGERQRFLAYAPDEDHRTQGVFIEVTHHGLMEAGTYEGANPTMGDAVFVVEWNHTYDDFNQAFNRARERMG